MLFNKGKYKTPFSSLIGGKRKTTNSVEFATSGIYNQRRISAGDFETAPPTAPDSTHITRAEDKRHADISESVYPYAKQSNMGTLSGVNIA